MDKAIVLGPDGFQIDIRSSWIAGNGDVMEVGARRANGKKMQPRKKRGIPISEGVRRAQAAKAERAREIRRCGFAIGKSAHE